MKSELEALMPTFPPNVVEAYAKLKADVGNISTPAAAVARALYNLPARA